MKNIFTLINCSLVPPNKALVASLAPGSLLGRGVFETMRASNGKIVLLKDHLSRLDSGLKTLKIKNPYPHKKIKEFLSQLLKKNNLKSSRVRLTIWQHEGAVNICIVQKPYNPLSARQYAKGYDVITCSLKLSDNNRLKRVKSIEYLPYLRAYKKAQGKGKDEAILVNQRNCVMEGSRTNIFLVNNGILCTPEPSSGCLKGIARQQVMRIAKRFKIKVQEMKIMPKDLKIAEEIFVTNAVLGIMPVKSVDGKRIGKGHKPGVTQRISKIYKKEFSA